MQLLRLARTSRTTSPVNPGERMASSSLPQAADSEPYREAVPEEPDSMPCDNDFISMTGPL